MTTHLSQRFLIFRLRINPFELEKILFQNVPEEAIKSLMRVSTEAIQTYKGWFLYSERVVGSGLFTISCLMWMSSN